MHWLNQRLILLAATACLFILGIGLFGHGLWIHAKAQLAQVLLERAWTQTSVEGVSAKPWPWADMAPAFHLSLPGQDQSFVVLSNTSGEALAFAPGHHQETPMPGDPGTVVVSGHRDTHFTILKDIKKGDTINVTREPGKIITYHVIDLKIVQWNKSGIDPWADKEVLVLSTCFPFDGLEQTDLRYLVYAERLNNISPSVSTSQPS